MKVTVTKFNSIQDLLMHMANLNNVNCNWELNKVEEEPVVDLKFFIYSLAQKRDWSFNKMVGYLNSIKELNPMAAFSIILREIAVYLDKKYEDHIENSEKIFVISSLDGRIHEVCKAHVKNYRNFAAFRTIEDAKFACNLLRDYLKDMFKKNAKKK